jgi:integrase
MAPRITDKIVKALPLPAKGQRIIFDGGPDRIKGFGVRVTAGGTKAFILDYWHGGKQRRFTIGEYGPAAWSVEKARAEAKELRKGIDRGESPLDRRVKLRTAPTVQDLAVRYRDDHLPSKVTRLPGETDAAYRLRLEKHTDWRIIVREILPRLKNRLVAEVNQNDCKALFTAITGSGRPVRANRVLACLSKMFSLSLVAREGEADPWRDAVKGNPCKGIARNPETARERFYSEAEIAAIADALEGYPGTHAANLLRLCMLTGCRPGEAIKATWDQFDIEAGEWRKPSSHTKQRRVHAVPLSPGAVELLQKVRAEVPDDCPYVFPGRKVRGGAWGPLKQYRTAWEYVVKTAKLAPDADGNPPRPYDLRHSFASFGAGHGLTLLLIGRLLGHTQGRTTQRYSHLHDDAMRQAVDKIGGTIGSAGKASGNVVQIKGGAA